jgi:hypothetical protein
MPLVSGLTLDKDRSEFTACGDILDDRLVNRLFGLEQVFKDLVRQLWGQLAQDLVALHHGRGERLIDPASQVQRFFMGEAW